MKKIFNKNNKGFTLLFSVLLITLVLAVSASIVTVTLKETILSGVGRESQFAFYAANTGIECAMYWDYKSLNDNVNKYGGKLIFGSSIDSEQISDPNIINEVKCADSLIYNEKLSEVNSMWKFVPGPESAVTTFGIKFKDEEYCAIVSVAKNYDSVKDETQTTITSRGYNTCNVSNPRRVERGLQLFY